jgi:hypothetical protein
MTRVFNMVSANRPGVEVGEVPARRPVHPTFGPKLTDYASSCPCEGQRLAETGALRKAVRTLTDSGD